METGDALSGRLALVVEDEIEIAELIATYLRREGAEVETAGSAEEAAEKARRRPPCIVILDLGLPGADGMEFLRDFRALSDAPVIVVSARESDEDKIASLGLGADDFVQKPFSPRVLAARAKAHLRRVAASAEDGAGPRARSFGPFSIDYEGKTLRRSGKPVPLSRKEFELLAFLASRPGRPFRSEELFERVWGREYGDVSTVAVHVQRLRKKIEDDPSDPARIRTVPGFGYSFEQEASP